ncbi:MAG: calycin-like domain-containing protein [Paludibacteraceae bacterium]|nr:calycin-like domain-containing protein [Paludibacteraceae bacterium]
MKKIFTTLFAGLMISAQVMAVSVQDVCGQFDGDLYISGDPFPGKSVYLLPGVVENTVTFVLPDFSFGSANLGDIVLPNIPMDANGQLTLENAKLYIKKLQLYATITVLNGIEEQGVTYNSIVTKDNAMVLLSIEADLPQPIIVLFAGNATTNNYALPNGGFEGDWTNNEPAGWHSFGSATGSMVDFVKDHTYQFIPSNDVRPGSTGTQSAMLSSAMLLGVKANGNCTNGQINAGSTTADAPADNYNFSDPANAGFNTPFQGRPDSIVFWAKYQPADKNPANEVNKARMSTIITTNARYQDPEAVVNDDVKIATASINYSATASMGWQRIAVPFNYVTENSAKEPAFILTTFTTNQVPGGGSSYTEGTGLSKKNFLDSVYLDDVELIYNKRISLLSRNETPLAWDGEKFAVEAAYCESCDTYSAMTTGVSTEYFVAFDGVHKCVFVYVIADDYAQSGEFTLYRVEYSDSDTEGTIDPQGIEETITHEVRFEKVLINGQLFIRSNDAWYNASGVRVK